MHERDVGVPVVAPVVEVDHDLVLTWGWTMLCVASMEGVAMSGVTEPEPSGARMEPMATERHRSHAKCHGSRPRAEACTAARDGTNPCVEDQPAAPRQGSTFKIIEGSQAGRKCR